MGRLHKRADEAQEKEVKLKMLVDEIASKYNGLSIREAVIYCKEHGLIITRQGLNKMGNHYYFIIKRDGHNIVYKSGLKEYVETVINPPPEGYVLISSLYHLATSKSSFYRIINKADNLFEYEFSGKGLKRYAKESDIRKLFENN